MSENSKEYFFIIDAGYERPGLIRKCIEFSILQVELERGVGKKFVKELYSGLKSSGHLKKMGDESISSDSFREGLENYIDRWIEYLGLDWDQPILKRSDIHVY